MLSLVQNSNELLAEEKTIKNVYCLYRVSTKGQVDKDDIPMQREACQKFVDLQDGWVIKKEFYEKGISGFKVSANDRDAIQELKASAERKEFDILLVFMFDRLGRRQDETPFIVEWFSNMGIEVWSTKEGQQEFKNEADYLINFMRFWSASGESRKTSMRVKTRLTQLTEQGVYTGGVAPFGYTLVKSGEINKRGKELMTLQVVLSEANIVRTIFDKTINEGYGSYVMAEYVNAMNITTHNGSKFQSNTIKRILKNPIYCGFYVKNEVVSPRQKELQIIKDDIFAKAQTILTQREHKTKERTNMAMTTKSSTMLGGNIYCGHCGKKLNSTSYIDHYTTKDGVKHDTERRYRYICSGKAMKRNSCNGQGSYVAEKVDKVVISAMRKCFAIIKDTPKNIALETRFKAEVSTIKKNIKQLQRENENQNRKLDELTEEIANSLMGESKFTPEMLSMAIDKCKDNIQHNTEQINECEYKLTHQEKELDNIDFYYNEFVSWADEFDKASLNRKRMIACSLFKEITVSKGYKIDILLNASYQQFIADTIADNTHTKVEEVKIANE